MFHNKYQKHSQEICYWIARVQVKLANENNASATWFLLIENIYEVAPVQAEVAGCCKPHQVKGGSPRWAEQKKAMNKGCWMPS